MKVLAMLFRFRVSGLALSFLLAIHGGLQAQTPSVEKPAAATVSPADLTQAELLKAYLQLRDQLHATQLAIVSSRAEAEASARAQAAAITEKLEALKTAMAAERERHDAETQQATAERQRQQLEMERSHRTVIWIASTFGAVGLLALLLMPLLQWRAIDRLMERTAQRPQLPAPDRQGLLAADGGVPSDQTVAQSNQRLMSMIDRMESRIDELEHTTAQPSATVSVRPAKTANGTETSTPPFAPPPRRAIPSNDQAALIAVLLGEGRSLLNTNRPKEAVACYDELLKLDKNHPEALVRKGTALERLKRDEEALQCYNLAIQADRKMTIAYLYKGGVCNRLARYGEAVESYERALQAEEAAA